MEPATREMLGRHLTELQQTSIKLFEKRRLTYHEVMAIMFPLKNIAERVN
ncbi:MAG: hypothetical protein WD824_02700 [Cyclobacteriaceae bacterium]